MNKIQTQLTNYKYSTIDQHGPITVTWWVLESKESEDPTGRPFTKEEEELFIAYTLNAHQNFPLGHKEVFLANPEDAPSLGLIEKTLSPRHPRILVLEKQEPHYSSHNAIAAEIGLLPSHSYKLPFDLIGEVDGL